MSYPLKQLEKAAELAVTQLMTSSNRGVKTGNIETDIVSSFHSRVIAEKQLSNNTEEKKRILYDTILRELKISAEKALDDTTQPIGGKKNYLELWTSSRGHISPELETAMKAAGLETGYGKLPSMSIWAYNDGALVLSDRNKSTYSDVDYEGKEANLPRSVEVISQVKPPLKQTFFKFEGQETLVYKPTVGERVTTVNYRGLRKEQEIRAEDDRVVAYPGSYPKGTKPKDICKEDAGVTSSHVTAEHFLLQGLNETKPGVYEPIPARFMQMAEDVAIGFKDNRVIAHKGDWVSSNKGETGHDYEKVRIYKDQEIKEMLASGKITETDEKGQPVGRAGVRPRASYTATEETGTVKPENNTAPDRNEEQGRRAKGTGGE